MAEEKKDDKKDDRDVENVAKGGSCSNLGCVRPSLGVLRLGR